MKYFFPLLLLFTLFESCKKIDYQYVVVCDFPALNYDENWLIVTDDASNVLKTFELPRGAKSVHENFEYRAKSAADNYNLHLVNKVTGENISSVTSHYGVRNGTLVSFQPDMLYGSNISSSLFAFINNIAMVDSIDVPGAIPGTLETFQLANNTTGLLVYLDASADLIIRARLQPTDPFSTLRLTNPASIAGIIDLQWSDFVPETDFGVVELPDDEVADLLEVSTVDADFKHYAVLLSNQFQPASNQFPLLPALDPASYFRVRVQYGEHIFEKIFQSGEALRIEKNDLDIKIATLSDQQILAIKTSGDPNLVETKLYITDPKNPRHHCTWNIQAPPELSAQMALPDFTDIVPGWMTTYAYTTHFQVSAYKYDQLEYTQILAGFPYKGGDGRVFPVARAGLQMVTKNY